MPNPSKKPATYAELEAVPPHLVAEILAGELVTHPRPAPKHSVATNSLTSEISPPFQKGRGGPGGWIFLDEPELHLGFDVVVPDIAGWRQERLPRLPEAGFIETAPDWVCEVLSPATKRYDRGVKRNIYAAAGVGHYWIIDPDEPSLEVFQLNEKRQWLLLATLYNGDMVCAAPFDAISFPLAVLFPFDATDPPVTG